MRPNALYKLLCSSGLLFVLTGFSSLKAQNRDLVTLSVENATLQKIFSSIEAQTSYRFVYTSEQMEDVRPVTISVIKVAVQEVLMRCFRDQPVNYSLEDKFVIIHRNEKKTKTDSFDLRGTIRNEYGDPVAGATVSVSGTSIATSSNGDGNFTLHQVPMGAAINFTGTDVEKYQEIFRGQKLLSVVLKTKTSRIDEVQVIAYGTTTKKLNTGNVSTVTSETIAEQPVSNPLAALEGRAPGLVIIQNSGVPGSGFFVQIRGRNSISNGNNPLYVVDGVPYPSNSLASIYTNSIIAGGNPLSSLNPGDIESINILKDADATAIYGSRGANGVILITTKRGKYGKTKIDFNSYFGAGHIDRNLKLLNTPQYLTMRNEAFKNDGTTPSLPNGDYDLLLWDTTRYTDWQKLLIGNTSNISDLQLTISGGNANTQFMIGGGYHRETTVFPGDYNNEKGSGHFYLNHISTDNKFKVDLSVTYAVENNLLPIIDFTQQAMSLAPDAPPLYDSTGNLYWTAGFSNPYSYLKRKFQSKTNNLISHATLNYYIMPSLQLRLAMGYNNIQMNEMQVNPTTAFNPAYHVPSGNTFFSTSSLETWILEPQLEYQKIIGPGKLDFLLGATAEQDIKNNITQSAYGFSSDALLENIAAASSIQIYTNNYSQYHYAAIFGRLNYNIDDKYILNITARRDGSSRFGPDKQFANFGALGAAWLFYKESFAKSLLPFLSFGKIRSSYGITGNDQIGDYKYLSTYSPTPLTYQNASGLIPTNLFNPDYAWETNKKFEAGLELGFMKDRLFFSASYYNNKSSNQLTGYPLPYITGFSFVEQNLQALVQNTGLEFTLNYAVVKSQKFNWGISLNLTIPDNKLVSYPGLEQSGYANFYTVGKSLNTYKSYQYLEVDPQSGLYQFSSAQGKPTLSPVYPNDLKAIKEVGAIFYGGLQNNFQYKGWRLDVFFQFSRQAGFNYIRSYPTTPGMLGNQPAVVINRWQQPGDQATFQKFSQAYDSAFYSYLLYSFQYGDNTVSNASYIRLKNVSLSYTLPGSIINKLKLQNLRIYVQAQNLLTITNYFGIDPENQSGSSLPPLRIITGGIQITF